ncbi:hypothetical protein O6H91_14G008100 [Diphasiastrum complanatum]|uniref:Uncharacterized protein n=11 Tax=Diphasiastrum complanatum TaxID=34168 RepID=A0ACC2BLI6_DIPCM|nr:hypothetical protein O6H91_14G008100 [Diphasiastrum complanatum]KAJ7530556.1 hypothetical protein O6H91_14G008100 [Diphasiastrum complanatum]KAJ7530557.1 hypothetical protein O6H91_14G008100 [Diphasiastrum complanatum]KAJ7530558.1 hypothetical protein O6H91_14G008100 [Diphasiastrum complanatum]KAJ7530559.1 hypothetical protein O6H91_14G008100 [Diphasiastrum complanatum]
MSTTNSSIPITKFPSHQLSNGLYVSGRPDQYKEKAPSMSSIAMPYTGGDVKKSGELGKMFDIPVAAPKSKASGQLGGTSSSRSGTLGGIGSHSGPLQSGVAPRSAFSTTGPISSVGVQSQSIKSGPQRSNSGPLAGSGGLSRQGSTSGPLPKNPDSMTSGASLKTSGSMPSVHVANPLKTSGSIGPGIPATGLITSGPISSGPLSSSKKFSGPIETGGSGKFMSGPPGSNQAINNLSHDQEYSFRRNFPKVILWTVIPLFVMGFIAGAFILAAVQNSVLLIIVAVIFGAVVMLVVWNTLWGKRAVLGFTAGYPEAELKTAKDGQYVKVTGVVTCGSVSLESSFQRVNRCIYTSTGLYEYRGVNSLPANSKHRRFTWGVRHLERHVVDFYISDLKSGLRALVKAGYGATVCPYVEESIIIEITQKPKELPSDFLSWLTERNLSRDERTMRLTEGFIKEGSTVTVLGVIQQHENVLMIVAPPEPVSTGCQWQNLLLPSSIEGIVIRSEETSFKVDVA